MTAIRHRTRLLGVLLSISLAALAVLGVGTLRTARVRTGQLQDKLVRMRALRADFSRLKEDTDTLQRRVRKVTPETTGLTEQAEALLSRLGLGANITAVKPGESVTMAGGLRRESARIEFRRLTLNALVNLLFRIDRFPEALVVSSLVVRTDFERPELLNVDLELVRISRVQ